jgi:1-acyl-sn-glycerol-3-phosphate acyltransferase
MRNIERAAVAAAGSYGLYKASGTLFEFLNPLLIGDAYEEIGDSETVRAFYAASHAAVGGISKLVFNYRVEGAEHTQIDGPAIIACNHLHASDTVFVPTAVPYYHVTVLGREGVMSSPITGKLFELWGAIMIHRPAEGQVANRDDLPRIKAPLYNGQKELIFSEGTRTPGTRPGYPKRGIFQFSQETEAKIIPAVIKGSDRLLDGAGVIVKFSEAWDPPTNRRQHRAMQQNFMEHQQEMFDSIEYPFAYADPVKITIGADT